MLEGTVARILNQLLGKYVVDLDTENLNIGIFSGKVQLTDLKLKPEALYELNLPIEVKTGTIGKIWLQIPWNALWNQNIIINIEDIHMVANPIVRNEAFDPETNKRLLRAFKKAILEKLENSCGILGGPTAFADHLVSNILSYVQLNITNIHVRYEDTCSWNSALSAGLCIGSITAQTTNSKWRRASYDPTAENIYYQVKFEAVSVYWNTDVTVKEWDLPTEYYQWRNSMVKSMENYCFDGEIFKFVLNPMTTKFRLTINKNKTLQVSHIETEIIVQDCSLQLTKTQYDSMTAVFQNFKRMLISWQFLEKRPLERILDNQKIWWRYAYWATLEQRVRPLTWTRMKKVREDYKNYMKTYKEIISNPHNTELKLDLQKQEDNLSMINVLIARQHTRLLMKSSSLTEKSFWSLLPSPEKVVLCEKIGYSDNDTEKNTIIGHTYYFKLGNFNLTLSNGNKEVLSATVTQTILTYKPNTERSTYTFCLKIEGLILEGNGPGNSLTTILSSEHLKDSPAFFLKLNLEKLAENEKFSHRLQVALDSLELIYNKKAFEELEYFLHATKVSQRKNLLNYLKIIPDIWYDWVTEKIIDKWDLHLNIKCPYFVIPESSSCLVSENLLVIDLGRFTIKSEICQKSRVSDSFTQMEMEEKLYSKLFVDCREFQILFCDKNDQWKDARREKDTNMHLVPKTGFCSVYALSVLKLPNIPSMKFNINFNSLKFNVSEKKMGLMLKFFDIDQIRINLITDAMQPNLYLSDTITEISGLHSFRNIQKSVAISDTFKYKKRIMSNPNDRNVVVNGFVNCKDLPCNMNEAWARTVDLPGLEDNISPKNTIQTLYGIVLNEFSIMFSKSSDSSDRQYLMLRLGQFTMDVAFMTYGPAYQMSVHSVLLTDKLHTTPSGQYLDLIYTPLPTSQDVVTVLYRKVKASCPDFWTHFHGVETSLVANFGTLHLLLHQEAVHTIIKYSKYLSKKMQSQTSQTLKNLVGKFFGTINEILHKPSDVPVPAGSVKFSQSARMTELNVNVCDSDYDIVNVQIAGLEVDFLFRANERFVFRSFLSSINVEHMSPLTLYSKVLYTDEDKVFEVKYVRNASHLSTNEMMLKDDNQKIDGVFKFQLGRIHFIVLYKLMVQLKRFIVNLEALDYLEKVAQLIETAVKTATDTLKNKTKISLAINVSGPVLLIPQKSSSPNVIVIDTGNLKIENFFKENEIEVVENILLKMNETVVTRGIMTLQSTLEMQETLIEPLCLTMDIKKSTNIKSAQKMWDIDSNLDKIEITLGQKDLAMVMSIYTDNIGEANLVDFLPEQIRSPSILSEIFEQDDSVRDLEVFFSDPKQKFLSAKCRIDEVKLLLFFDAGELLSSPIRDLNHGLCKLEINDIDSCVLIYTDESCDGKLSVDKLCIEEIGPDANIHNRVVLGTPPEDGRNNNLCNITVNRPPLIDVTFHQNKNCDKSADIIIGRLCLSLSIPFCEKIALYILECIPKDSQESGIINPGYEGDIHHIEDRKSNSNSLTVSVRINRPELMFLVETTSNRKRYFITKTEIMIDYSNHSTRTNLATSFSGLHSLFYDLDEYSDQPYTILRHCDIELCRNVDENSEKVTLAVSGVYVKICSEVVHSINDILNDVVEHFKLPERETDKLQRITKQEKNITDQEDLWDPKKMDSYIKTSDLENPINSESRISQILTVPKFEIVLILEIEQVQMLLVRSTIELSLSDWSTLLHCSGEVSLQGNYYNENVQNWEPLVEPVTLDENLFRPWECQVKIFQDKSLPINDRLDQKHRTNSPGSSASKTQKASRSYTTTEDEDSGEDMMYLEPSNSTNFSSNRRVKTSLSTFLEDSDSETDEGALEKLAAAITDLFTGDWNEQEDSEIENSSDEENDATTLNSKPTEKSDVSCDKCLYIMVNSRDPFNLTITPAFLKVFNDLLTQYSSKIIYVQQNRRNVNVLNDIGPHTTVELYEKNEENKQDILVTLKKFEKEDSLPNSPTKNLIFAEESYEEEDRFLEKKVDFEQAYDFKTVRSLAFSPDSTSALYDKINKHYVKISVPNFNPVQTNCPNRNLEKLIRLSSTDLQNQNYFLALKHSVGRMGRQIVVGSPLQIKNETCFALNILYQPSILQQMNLEPIGEVTNPFETTMRIAILEPQEEYNVPLYVAYHCKLFVQPAYAEGHYSSATGIWWKDMASELGTTYNLICKPKNEATTDTFTLKVALKRNVATKNSFVHSVPNYQILLLPPLILHNFLPYTLLVENLTGKQIIKAEPSENLSIYTLDLSKDQKLSLKVTYNSLTWTGHLTLTGHLDEKIVAMTSEQKDGVKDLNINVKCDREGGCHLIFYAPYWIVNKTGLPINVKASSSHITHTCPNDDILLFTYKRHCKQTLNVKVYDSNWSNEFGMECSGTTGLVVCKDPERRKKYLFFLNTKLSNFCPRMTRIVSILPSFLVINNTDKSLRFMENNEKTDLWIDLEPKKCQIFWPETSSMQIHVKYKDSKSISHPFFISCHHKTVLRMEKGTALTVEVKGGTEGPFKIIFFQYQVGDAPILIKNYCSDLFLKIQQQDQSPVTLINPNHCILYTWDDPTRPRRLVWNVYNNKSSGFPLDITKDSYGVEKIKFQSVTPTNVSEPQSSSSEDDSEDSSSNTAMGDLNKQIRKDKIVIYWACYVQGPQRVLLFTQDQRIYDNLLGSHFHEKTRVEMILAVNEIGLSVFTSESDRKEHIFVSVNDFPAIWEVNVGQKWKTLTLELASWIEDKYTRSGNHKKCQIKDYVHIDFEKMFMIKPFFAEMRRTYFPAIFCHYRQSETFRHLNFHLQHLQIDNSHTDSVVFQPNLTNVNRGLEKQKPLLKLSASKQSHPNFETFRYLDISLADLIVNVENDLWTKIGELILFCNRKFLADHNISTGYIGDITDLRRNITSNKAMLDLCQSRSKIEHVNLSSFGIQLNISNRIQISPFINGMTLHRVLSHLFPYNMAPYMPMEGVHHKITAIELVDLHQDIKQVIDSLIEEVSTQFLQQYYSQVLGLQVLVNTFAIQPGIEIGPTDTQKNALLISYACRCILGHINMSTAALETCIQDIFPNIHLDMIIQKSCRKYSYEVDNAMSKIVCQSSKNFNMAVPSALAQLFVKTHTNNQCDGEVFFKTTGKALFSLITRHPDVKCDSVMLAKEALKRAAFLGEPIKIHQRMNRHKNLILGLTPFSKHESIGHYILETMSNSKYSGDTYWTHTTLDSSGKSVILVSLEHVFRLNKFSLWGPWEVEWTIELDNMISMQRVSPCELTFNLKQNDSTLREYQIRISAAEDLLIWLNKKIEQAIILSMEDKSWSPEET